MSLLLNHSMEEAVALMRGELSLATTAQVFPIEGLDAWQLHGLEPAVGSSVADSDLAWDATVRGWWSMGLTWGLFVKGNSREIAWNLLLPGTLPAAVQGVSAHLQGARLEAKGPFARMAGSLIRLTCRAAVAGHSGAGHLVRLETAVRSMAGQEFAVLVLARAMARPEVQEEILRLGAEEQFIQDEHLARPGLENKSHSSATRYLGLVEAARKRATAAIQEGGWKVRTLVATTSESAFSHLQALIHSAYASDGGEPEPLRWQEVEFPRGLTFLRTAEVAALSRPPKADLPGFMLEMRRPAAIDGVTPSPVFGTAAPGVGNQPCIGIGRILGDDGQPGPWLYLSTSDLCRHLLVAGMTGSGKSVSCEHILLELWIEHRIPWLVVEPGMNPSYRRLLNSEIREDLQVYAVGNPKARRLAMNPLAVPAGIGLAEHISGLFAVLASAFELVAPMPEVLAKAIEETYRNHGWDPAELTPSGPPPLLADLLEEIERTIRKLGYPPDITATLKAGLGLRLGRLASGLLAPELSARDGLNMEALTARPCVIELSALLDADSQALIMGFIALQLRHWWRLQGPSKTLRHVTLIEEAHRLLRAVPENTAHAARSRAVEDMANLLAEMRSMGVGLIIADQTPSALVASVIANTGTKILHRLDHPADRECAGRASGLPADGVDLLGALRVGDAIVRTDQRSCPFRLRMPNPAVTYGTLPLPALPQPAPVPCAKAVAAPTCEVCGEPECSAKLTGADRDRLAPRLKTLQGILREGQDAVWAWAGCELAQAGIKEPSKFAPLCFSRPWGVPLTFRNPP